LAKFCVKCGGPLAISGKRFGRRIMMFRNAISSLLVILATLAAPYVMAADACQPVYNALTKIMTTPSHSYSTQTAPLVNGHQRNVETIYVQGKTYMFAKGKWMVSPATPTDVLKQELEKYRGKQPVTSCAMNPSTEKPRPSIPCVVKPTLQTKTV
jgi:hypothetical protein